jgi:hypothetical protein
MRIVRSLCETASSIDSTDALNANAAIYATCIRVLCTIYSQKYLDLPRLNWTEAVRCALALDLVLSFGDFKMPDLLKLLGEDGTPSLESPSCFPSRIYNLWSVSNILNEFITKIFFTRSKND